MDVTGTFERVGGQVRRGVAGRVLERRARRSEALHAENRVLRRGLHAESRLLRRQVDGVRTQVAEMNGQLQRLEEALDRALAGRRSAVPRIIVVAGAAWILGAWQGRKWLREARSRLDVHDLMTDARVRGQRAVSAVSRAVNEAAARPER